MGNIFGFSHTNINRIYSACIDIVGKEQLQLLSDRDPIYRRFCYLGIGINTLIPPRIKSLSNARGTLVVIDCVPELLRIEGINILDAKPGVVAWNPSTPKWSVLNRSLQHSNKNIIVKIAEDDTLKNMVVNIQERSVLDKVLSAAKTMDPTSRASLHKDVSMFLAGKLSFVALCRRCESRGATGKSYQLMLTAVKSEVAKRLGVAIKEYQNGASILEVADLHRVEASEIRFICAHLNAS